VGRGRLFQNDGSKLNGTFVDDKLEGSVEYEDAFGNIVKSEQVD
jgi:hypothetical protein